MTRFFRVLCLSGALCLGSLSMYARGQLDLKAITKGELSQETMTAVRPSADGETYTQISPSVQASRRTSFLTLLRPEADR